MENRKKIKSKQRLEIATKVMAAIASNPNFKGHMQSFSEYVKWADALIKENEKFSDREGNENE